MSAVGEEGTRFSWGLVLAGAAVAVAVIFFLLTLGSGVGLLLVHPETDSQTPPAFLTGGAIFFFVAQAFGFAVGGHVTGRLMGSMRETLLQEEIRAALHGLTLWAVAVLATAILAGMTATAALYGMARAPSPVAAESEVTVDRLFRPNERTEAAAPAEREPARAEALRLIAADLAAGGRLAEQDRWRLERLTAEQSGVASPEARQRVATLEDGFVAATRHRLLMARKLGSYVSLWIAFSLIFGAGAAMISAVTARIEDDRSSLWTPSVWHRFR